MSHLLRFEIYFTLLSYVFIYCKGYYINMEDKKLEVLLAATPESDRSNVEKRYRDNGFVEAVTYLWDNILDMDAKVEAEQAVEADDLDSKYYKLLVQDFDIKTHFSQVCSHRKFIKKAFQRFKKYLNHMKEEDAEKHDLTKFMMAQAVGYTARWVHNVDNASWKKALDHHYHIEPHHPQYYRQNKRMERRYLEESLIDMASSRWERNLGGDENARNYDIVDFNPVYLSRYQPDDLEAVKALIKRIQDDDPN